MNTHPHNTGWKPPAAGGCCEERGIHSPQGQSRMGAHENPTDTQLLPLPPRELPAGTTPVSSATAFRRLCP